MVHYMRSCLRVFWDSSYASNDIYLVQNPDIDSNPDRRSKPDLQSNSEDKRDRRSDAPNTKGKSIAEVKLTARVIPTAE